MMRYLPVPSSPHAVEVNSVWAIDHICKPVTTFITESKVIVISQTNERNNHNTHQREKQPNSHQGDYTKQKQ